MVKKRGNFERKGPILSAEHQALLEWHEKVRFKRCLMGGVLESDVWRQLDELYGLYQRAIAAERVRYDALLARKNREEDPYETEV